MITCPYCKKPAKWVENRLIYGRNYGKSYMCYLCEPCDAYVGCHNNTKEPLGTMANKSLRGLRKKAHAAIDPFWKNGLMSRRSVYNKLSEFYGIDVHIGEADEKLCESLIKHAENILGEEL